MKIEAASWNRFNSDWLAVTREVLGRKHRFNFEGRHVEVCLPQEEHADRGKGYDEVAECIRWKKQNGKDIPENFHIFKVDLTIDLEKPIEVRKALLEFAPVRRELITETKAKLFDKIIEEHESLALKAFDYWIRVVRWKIGFWLIGQPEIQTPRSGWGTYLIEKDGGKRFWAGSHEFTIRFTKAVTIEEWDVIQEALSERREPPIWIEFLFDAQHKLEMGDKSGCILSLAIACESIFRHAVYNQFPDVKHVDERLIDTFNEINIRAIFRNITKFRFWDKNWKKNCDWSRINEIFNLRNSVVHLGRTEGIKDDDLVALVKSAERFIYFADAAL